MKKIYVLTLLVLGLFFKVQSQSTTITTSGTATSLWSTTAISGLTFGFKNTNAYPVKITNISTYCPAVSVTYTLFYNPTLISGAPGAMNTSNGWIQIGSPSVVAPTAIGVTQIFSGLNFIVPPNTIYRMCIQTSNNGPYYYTSGTSADYFTNGGGEIYTQANTVSQSYTGPVTGLTTTPRGFAGSITFEKAASSYNDASISKLVSPIKFCSSSQNVSVKVANMGKNVLTNVNVDWTLDGAPQPTIAITNPLDTIGHPSKISDTVVSLGAPTYLPNQIRNIVVWTSSPNGVADTTTNNDTLRLTLRPGLNGTYTLGGTSPDFNTFTSAVNNIDSFGRCGPVVFNVTSGTIFTEPPLIIKNIDSITFQKFGTGANPLVVGVNGVGTIDAVIALGGARYIIFDGIDVADAASNITTVTQMEYGYGIVNNLNSAAVLTGSCNNIIKNCKATLRRTYTSTIGIAQSTLTVATSLVSANHNNRYENIKVENSYNGILLQGTPAFPDSNNVITSTGGDTTIVGAATANDIGNGTALTYGIQCAEQRNVEVSKCIVRNVTHTAALIGSGIWLSNATTTTDYGTANIYNNTVYNLNRITATAAPAAGAAMIGIRIEVATLAKARVYNNVVYGLSSLANTSASVAASQTLRGISFGQSTGTGSAEFYHNSVNIDNANGFTSAVGFWKGLTGNATLRNNIFNVTSVANTTTAKHHAIYVNAGTITSSNNVYWSSLTANGYMGYAAGADKVALAQFAAATSTTAPTDGNEQGSAFANPNFASTTDLTFAGMTPAVSSGTPITTPLIATDMLGNLRSSTTPTIGAFETTQPLFDSAAPVITNVIVKSGSVPSIYATIRDNSAPFSAGNVNLWYRSGATGTFSPLTPDSFPVGTMNGNYKWSTSINSLPIGVYQFYIAARDIVGPGLNISVNPIQAATFNNFATSDPVNYLGNPDISVTTRTFSKTSTLAGGTYPVGASAPTYAKLTDVANALNAAEITGNIIFELQSDYDGTTGETFPITFNQWVNAGGNWTVTIRPAATATGRETSGYPASALPLFNLNGADRLLFDGRAGGTGTTSSWTLRSKRTTASSNSPAMQLTNGAQRNTIQYLKIETDNTTATSGNILISGTATTDGNSFNKILNNTITGRTDSAGIHAVGIYAAGTAGATNDSNIVLNNSLFNWSTGGVQVTATGNGANWQINNNHFYMTTAQTTAQTAIRFEAGATASGTRINGNFIGGTAINAGGTAWTNSVAGVWRGIVCAASVTDSAQIQNNTIQNITLTGGAGTYAAIEMTGALASIRSNTIGHATTTNSIQTSQLGTIISIWLNAATNLALIEGNTIANINSTGNTTAVGHNGIRIATAVTTAPLIIRNNSIYNLNALNPTTGSTTASMIGILSVYAGTQQTIEQNAIYQLSNSAQAGTNVFGINVTNTTGAGTISGNKVFNLNNTSNTATAQVVGIHLDLGAAWTVTNNMVALGSTIDSSAVITGIQDKTTGTNNTIAFNTILISGNAISTIATLSHAYRRTTASTTSIRNNMFKNVRTGGTANYAIANILATPATGWSANYNALNTTNSAQLGLWNTTATNFATWKTTSIYDTASTNTAPIFASLTDLHITAPTIGNTVFAGRPLAGTTKDFDGETRNAVTPYMGADEIPASPLPVVLNSFDAKRNGNDVTVYWATASEKNSSHFEIERSIDGKDFESLSKVDANGNSNTVSNYSYEDLTSPLEKNNLMYYRLKMVDRDGLYEYSNIVSVNKEHQSDDGLYVYPNPFNKEVTVIFESTTETEMHVEVTDITGKTMGVYNQQANIGKNTIGVNAFNNLPSGFYFMTVTVGNSSKILKLIKE